MKTYNKDEMLVEYLQIIQKQANSIDALRASNTTLKNRNESLLRDKKNYRRAALDWKVAYEDLNVEFMQANKVVLDLVERPLGEIERVIKAYKENM